MVVVRLWGCFAESVHKGVYAEVDNNGSLLVFSRCELLKEYPAGEWEEYWIEE